MLPRLRLKTKLVLAISGMVVAVVATLSFLYVQRLVQNRIDEAYASGDFVAHEVFHATRDALEIDLSDVRLKTNDPAEVEGLVQESLETDPGVNSLIESIVGYSPTIYDVAITDNNGRALLHSDAHAIGQIVPQREEFSKLRDGGFRKQMEVLFGAPRVYEVPIALERDGKPFGTIRVGLSTVFLKNELQPQMKRAFEVSGIAIFLSLILAGVLSNLALNPLASIAQRLDQLTAGQMAAPAAAAAPERTDEVGVVTSKINRLGEQMRNVQEVFSALKENLDQIMANLQDGLILFTRDARAVLVSASVETFVGKPRGAMLTHTVDEIFDSSTELGALVLEAFRTHTPVESREIGHAGHRVTVGLDFIEERGLPIGALLTMRDAESVHRIEDEIELSRRLAAIGRLTSGVAHEVKNPINAIVVHLEVLRSKLKEVDPDTKRHVEIINNEIRRLDRVVQTLVDFTRPVELRLAEIDLRRLVEEVVLLAAPEAERHGVRIEHHIAPAPLRVNIDADLIKQAALNIALNGVQAMEQGGLLTVTTMADGDTAVVAVTDRGPGIPPELHDKIYNLYFTTKKTGTGIGLAMTYRVMQLHNGVVEFDSAVGTGTTFRLRLPLAERAEAALDVRNHDKEVARQGS